ncbi:ACBP-domain-containing protein [Mycena indigotica]|uniref:ACBP-domain-containing protein n=1 Tax=Mycena indigotica TaxID=2126181 RepID=A0A8H6SMU6_9AGAR|nr:ACBP-domain-containing protein [Mycena indigotica]KAF7301541.1 ACBP-domain-containing protein [Mycena indigotica]
MATSNELIDAQFDRAVEIVQSLPKNGPIQTSYDEKLTMYSLYKQATAGNVTSPRPGMWDMLGRAKWDAWAKHKDLNPHEAKWLYVAALMKVLRKYSDRTVSADFIHELESYGGDPSNLVMSRTLSGSKSDSSGSTVSDEDIPPPHYTHGQMLIELEASGDEDDDDDEPLLHAVPAVNDPGVVPIHRPPSSVSSNRYRTPMAGSLLASSPPPSTLSRVPETQPMPGFETPSAFAEPMAPSSYVPISSSPFQQRRRIGHMVPPSRPVSRPTIEYAIENVQAHLAALSERMESLESLSGHLSQSRTSISPRTGGSPAWRAGRGSPHGSTAPQWDLDDLGMWSLVAHPISRGIESLKEAATFFSRDENRSPTMMIVRRLCLDISFVLCVLGVIRALWRKSGVRRREVKAALIILWRAILGTKPNRVMVDRGV